MKPPSTIMVLGHPFRVIPVPASQKKLPAGGHKNTIGRCDTTAGVIYYRPWSYENEDQPFSANISPMQERDTIVHECLHAMLNLGQMQTFEGTQEDIVARMTPLLLRLVRDNPELLVYLTSELPR